MTKKRKILFILISVICLITIGISCIYLKTRNTFTLKSTDLPTNDNSMAIMLETGNGTKTYKTSSDTAFPTKGYKYNAEKSYCLNGSTLTWDEANHRISTTVGGSEKCYVFFDVKPPYLTTSTARLLKDRILENNYGTAEITAKGTPNFANAATTDEGMYAAPDDYGTSYYFRGAVSNNWVKFNNMYWRIVRINGNNTVKLVYSGTTAPTETEKVIMAEVSTEIGMSAFNTNVNSAEYVGYKYTLGDAHGTSTDSTIKTVIDNWYNANLLSQTWKIADIVYCNDSNTYSGSVESNSFSGTGIGNTPTHFGDKRLISEANWLAGGSGPILTCPNKSDAFTVTDTTHGNTSLQYPIALLTADELVLAGTPYGQSNSSYYLYISKQYWTLSPIFMYSNGYAVQFIVNSFGDVSNANVFSNLAIRPVISLTSNIEATGDGTWNNPYIVQ